MTSNELHAWKPTVRMEKTAEATCLTDLVEQCLYLLSKAPKSPHNTRAVVHIPLDVIKLYRHPNSSDDLSSVQAALITIVRRIRDARRYKFQVSISRRMDSETPGFAIIRVEGKQ